MSNTRKNGLKACPANGNNVSRARTVDMENNLKQVPCSQRRCESNNTRRRPLARCEMPASYNCQYQQRPKYQYLGRPFDPSFDIHNYCPPTTYIANQMPVSPRGQPLDISREAYRSYSAPTSRTTSPESALRTPRAILNKSQGRSFDWTADTSVYDRIGNSPHVRSRSVPRSPKSETKKCLLKCTDQASPPATATKVSPAATQNMISKQQTQASESIVQNQRTSQEERPQTSASAKCEKSNRFQSTPLQHRQKFPYTGVPRAVSTPFPNYIAPIPRFQRSDPVQSPVLTQSKSYYIGQQSAQYQTSHKVATSKTDSYHTAPETVHTTSVYGTPYSIAEESKCVEKPSQQSPKVRQYSQLPAVQSQIDSYEQQETECGPIALQSSHHESSKSRMQLQTSQDESVKCTEKQLTAKYQTPQRPPSLSRHDYTEAVPLSRKIPPSPKTKIQFHPNQSQSPLSSTLATSNAQSNGTPWPQNQSRASSCPPVESTINRNSSIQGPTTSNRPSQANYTTCPEQSATPQRSTSPCRNSLQNYSSCPENPFTPQKITSLSRFYIASPCPETSVTTKRTPSPSRYKYEMEQTNDRDEYFKDSNKQRFLYQSLPVVKACDNRIDSFKDAKAYADSICAPAREQSASRFDYESPTLNKQTLPNMYLEAPTYQCDSYYEYPESEYPEQSTEKSKANILQCLSKTLGSTFDYLSTFLTAQDTSAIDTLKNNSQDMICNSTRDVTNCDTADKSQSRKDWTNARIANYGTIHMSQTRKDWSNVRITNYDVLAMSQSLKDCANARKCERSYSDSIKERAPESELRKVLINNLVMDTHCPGVIQETLDGTDDFNSRAFNITFGDISLTCLTQTLPDEEPLTLLEAFSLRIDKEKHGIMSSLRNDATQEEILEAIDKHFDRQYPTELNRSIKSLLITECIEQSMDVSTASKNSFDADIHRLDVPCRTNSNLKLVVFMGHTTPKEAVNSS